jgi:hypothetical protein
MLEEKIYLEVEEVEKGERKREEKKALRAKTYSTANLRFGSTLWLKFLPKSWLFPRT